MDQKNSKLEQALEFSMHLELLCLCLESGLDLTHAIEEMVYLYPQAPFSQSFQMYINQLQIGKSKEDALLSLEKSLGTPWAQTFTQSILASHRYGIPLTKILRDQSQILRTQSQHLLERQIYLKQLKLLLPLFLCILPAVMLVLITPLLVQLLRMSF